jgi:hypothetical protein
LYIAKTPVARRSPPRRTQGHGEKLLSSVSSVVASFYTDMKTDRCKSKTGVCAAAACAVTASVAANT